MGERIPLYRRKPGADSRTSFVLLNPDWNAEPNVPLPRAIPDNLNDDVILYFVVTHAHPRFSREEELGFVRFHDCSRFRFTSVNDHGWYDGQCRFSNVAPEWGAFYEVIGDFRENEEPRPWWQRSVPLHDQRNFLFYFRDETFECSARDWSFDKNERNSLLRLEASDASQAKNDDRAGSH